MQLLSGKIESGMEGVISTNPFLSNQTVKEFEMTAGNLPQGTNSVQVCSVDGCASSFGMKRGMCNKHYIRSRRHGNVHHVVRASAENPRYCSVETCNQPYHSTGYCKLHYSRFQVHGNPLTILLNVGEGRTFEERFWSRVKKGSNEKGCWEWQGTTDEDGYGQIKYQQKCIRAHRFAWFLTWGAMPTQDLLHSCDNPPCVNPDHLREGTPAENTADMMARKRHRWDRHRSLVNSDPVPEETK